jgi:predicted transcriptional regulator
MAEFLRRARSVAFETAFGPLERELLGALWRRGAPARVREMHAAFPALAYTTLMTTLDRLHKKGALERGRTGRAFVYRPRFARAELLSRLATEAIGALLGEAGPGTRPVLSCFVEAISRKDERLLDELQLLVRAARAELKKAGRR